MMDASNKQAREKARLARLEQNERLSFFSLLEGGRFPHIKDLDSLLEHLSEMRYGEYVDKSALEETVSAYHSERTESLEVEGEQSSKRKSKSDSSVRDARNVDMSDFRRMHVTAQQQREWLNVRRVELDYNKLSAILATRYFPSEAQLKTFLDEMGSKLDQLRTLFVFAKRENMKFHEERNFQPVFVFFLQGFLAALPPSLSRSLGKAIPANDVKLSFSLQQYKEVIDGVRINGRTDVIISREKTPQEALCLVSMLRAIAAELKIPLGPLHGSGAFDACKDQLIAQLIALSLLWRQNSFGLLTDLFSITIMSCKPNQSTTGSEIGSATASAAVDCEESQRDAVSSSSQSASKFSLDMIETVVSSREYLLHLLLLFHLFLGGVLDEVVLRRDEDLQSFVPEDKDQDEKSRRSDKSDEGSEKQPRASRFSLRFLTPSFKVPENGDSTNNRDQEVTKKRQLSPEQETTSVSISESDISDCDEYEEEEKEEERRKERERTQEFTRRWRSACVFEEKNYLGAEELERLQTLYAGSAKTPIEMFFAH